MQDSAAKQAIAQEECLRSLTTTDAWLKKVIGPSKYYTKSPGNQYVGYYNKKF